MKLTIAMLFLLSSLGWSQAPSKTDCDYFAA